MLPPGIFAWISGHGESVSPTTLQALAGAHPSWALDMATYGPWNEAVDAHGAGRFLKAAHIGAPDETIVVTGECFSTMEAARMLAEAGQLGPWGAVLAVRQTGGRGQLRRPWVSSPGNVHVSLVLPELPSQGPWSKTAPDLLPLVAGYMCAEVLDSLGADIRIKWPNDLLQAGRKVGGMLHRGTKWAGCSGSWPQCCRVTAGQPATRRLFCSSGCFGNSTPRWRRAGPVRNPCEPWKKCVCGYVRRVGAGKIPVCRGEPSGLARPDRSCPGRGAG